MRMIWHGIESTFRAVFRQHETISQQEMSKRVNSMRLELYVSTPKDTGFASSRWQVDGAYPAFRVSNDASYIEYLNHGSSRQAPAYFIEAVALKYGRPHGAIVTTIPSHPG